MIVITATAGVSDALLLLLVVPQERMTRILKKLFTVRHAVEWHHQNKHV